MGVNKVILLGNLGADPEIRYTPSQTAVVTMRVATTERIKNQQGEWVDKTEWHRVIVWGKQGENCAKYLSKGRQVFIDGKIRTNKWTDKEGKERYTTEIIANSVQFVGSIKDGQGASTSPSYGQSPSTRSSESYSAVEPPLPEDMMPTGGNFGGDEDEIPF